MDTIALDLQAVESVEKELSELLKRIDTDLKYHNEKVASLCERRNAILVFLVGIQKRKLNA